MPSDSLILGIECTCDDTSVSLVRNDRVLDCMVISSADSHKKFGGVLPELAAREHEKNLVSMVEEIFDRTGVFWSEVTHIAYSDRPGLPGCLLTGKIFAKTLSFIYKKNLIPVDHVYGHIFSVFMTEEIRFPVLSLVVSGKTTAIYYVKSFRDVELLDETMDNALGEVYDKVARELGLPYPGGEEIDKLFNPNLKVPKLLSQELNPAKRFSFSGILSATHRICRDLNNREMENKNEYVATIFQKWVIGGLISKIKYWASMKNIDFVSISGGVAANRYLRDQLKKTNLKTIMVDRQYAGDNAAMIAFYARYLID